MGSNDKVDLDETLEVEDTDPDDGNDDSDDDDLELRHLTPPLFFLVLKDEYDERIPLISGLNRIGRDSNRCRIVLRSPTVSKLHAVIEVKNQRAFLFDVGSRNRTRQNSSLLSFGGRFELKDGDQLRFGNLSAAVSRKGGNDYDEDVLVPDSQPQESGRTSSTKIAADFSLLSEDGTFDCSAIDSSYSRLRTTICTIVQDSILETTGNDDNDDDDEEDDNVGTGTDSADDTLEGENERPGGLFTQTYSPVASTEPPNRNNRSLHTDDDSDDDDEPLLSSQTVAKIMTTDSADSAPTQCFLSDRNDSGSLIPKTLDCAETQMIDGQPGLISSDIAETRMIGGDDAGTTLLSSILAADPETQMVFGGVRDESPALRSSDEAETQMAFEINRKSLVSPDPPFDDAETLMAFEGVEAEAKGRKSSLDEPLVVENPANDEAPLDNDATQIFDDVNLTKHESSIHDGNLSKCESSSSSSSSPVSKFCVGRKVQFISPEEKSGFSSPGFRISKANLPRIPKSIDESSEEDDEEAPTQQLVFKAPTAAGAKAARRSSILKQRGVKTVKDVVDAAATVVEEPETQVLDHSESTDQRRGELGEAMETQVMTNTNASKLRLENTGDKMATQVLTGFTASKTGLKVVSEDDSETQVLESARQTDFNAKNQVPETQNYIHSKLTDSSETEGETLFMDTIVSAKKFAEDFETQMIGLTSDLSPKRNDEVGGEDEDEGETQMVGAFAAVKNSDVYVENDETQLIGSVAAVNDAALADGETQMLGPDSLKDARVIAKGHAVENVVAEGDAETQVITTGIKTAEREAETQVVKDGTESLGGNLADTQNLTMKTMTPMLTSTYPRPNDAETQVIASKAPSDSTNPIPPSAETRVFARNSVTLPTKSIIDTLSDKLATQDFDGALGCSFDEDKENLVRNLLEKEEERVIEEGAAASVKDITATISISAAVVASSPAIVASTLSSALLHSSLLHSSLLHSTLLSTSIPSPSRSKESQFDEFHDSFESLTPQKKKKKNSDEEDPESLYFDADAATPTKRLKTTPNQSPTVAAGKKTRKALVPRGGCEGNEIPAMEEPVMAMMGNPETTTMMTSSIVVPETSDEIDNPARVSKTGKSKGNDNLSENDSVIDVFDFRGLLSESSSQSSSSPSTSQSTATSQSTSTTTSQNSAASQKSIEDKVEDDDKEEKEEERSGEMKRKIGDHKSTENKKTKPTVAERVIGESNLDDDGHKDRNKSEKKGKENDEESNRDNGKAKEITEKKGKAPKSRKSVAATKRKSVKLSMDKNDAVNGEVEEEEEENNEYKSRTAKKIDDKLENGENEGKQAERDANREIERKRTEGEEERESLGKGEQEEGSKTIKGKAISRRKSTKPTASTAAGRKKAAVSKTKPIAEDDVETQAYQTESTSALENVCENNGPTAAESCDAIETEGVEEKSKKSKGKTSKGAKKASKKTEPIEDSLDVEAASLSKDGVSSKEVAATSSATQKRSEVSGKDAAATSSAPQKRLSSDDEVLSTPPNAKEEVTPPRPGDDLSRPGDGDSQSTSAFQEIGVSANGDPAVPVVPVVPAQWNCPLCTFLNHGEIPDCEMCLSPRVYKKTRKSEILPRSPLRMDRLCSPKSKRAAGATSSTQLASQTAASSSSTAVAAASTSAAAAAASTEAAASTTVAETKEEEKDSQGKGKGKGKTSAKAMAAKRQTSETAVEVAEKKPRGRPKRIAVEEAGDVEEHLEKTSDTVEEVDDVVEKKGRGRQKKLVLEENGADGEEPGTSRRKAAASKDSAVARGKGKGRKKADHVEEEEEEEEVRKKVIINVVRTGSREGRKSFAINRKEEGEEDEEVGEKSKTKRIGKKKDFILEGEEGEEDENPPEVPTSKRARATKPKIPPASNSRGKRIKKTSESENSVASSSEIPNDDVDEDSETSSIASATSSLASTSTEGSVRRLGRRQTVSVGEDAQGVGEEEEEQVGVGRKSKESKVKKTRGKILAEVKEEEEELQQEKEEVPVKKKRGAAKKK